MSNKNTNLRICASCEFIFRESKYPNGCPYCGFGDYGANWAIGKAAYRLEKTQELWKKKIAANLVDKIFKATLNCINTPLLEALETEAVKDLLTDQHVFDTMLNQNKEVKE